MEPGTPLLWNWHIDAICEHLEAVTAGQIQNLLINIPPGHMKSLIVSVFWPAWEWLENPGIRSLFSSYAMPLALRDSVRCRDLVTSDWYQERFSPTWRVRSDQSSKTLFENDRTGWRYSLSMGGSGTGFRGNKVVCLDASVCLTTDCGDIPIGRIVDERLPVKVLGSSGAWQVIEAYEKSPGRSLLEIETEDGAVLLCTEDHPVYLDGIGYKRASDVLYYLYGNIYMRRLRSAFRPFSGSCGTNSRRAILFKSVFREAARGRKQSRMGKRAGDSRVPGLQSAVSVKSRSGSEKDILFLCLSGQSTTRSKYNRVPRVQGSLSPDFIPAKVLLKAVCKQQSPCRNSGRKQWPICRRRMADGLHTGVPQKLARCCPKKRRQEVCPLRANQNASGASHRRLKRQSQPHKLGDVVHPLSPGSAYQGRHSERLDEAVRVVAIRRRPAPDAVYNVRVATDHNYYAGGLLTHNCDDPLNAKETYSKVARDECIFWWDKVMSSRLNDMRVGAKVIIMQRLHEEDLSGHVLDLGGYDHLCLPSEFDPVRRIYTSIGWTDPRREAGELLFPELFTPAVLAEARKNLGVIDYAGQHSQLPAPMEGAMFQAHWFKIKDAAPAQLASAVRYWDKANALPGKGDLTVGVLMGKDALGEYWILDVVRLQVESDERNAKILQTAQLDSQRPYRVKTCVEREPGAGKESTAIIIKMLAGFSAEEDPVSGRKEERAEGFASQSRAGNVHLLKAEWNAPFLAVLSVFPNGAHDDDVDASSGAFNKLALAPTAQEWFVA